MASPSQYRKVHPTDYPLIRAVLKALVAKLAKSRRKAMFQHLNVDAAMDHIFQFDHAYIVADSYLVIYELAVPWFSDTLMLNEILVLRLAVGEGFAVVPAFLERQSREAGCQLIVAGTALAKSDAALASLYHRSGFTSEAITLTKET